MNKLFFAVNCLLFLVLFLSLCLQAGMESGAEEAKPVTEAVQIDGAAVSCQKFGPQRWLLNFPDPMQTSQQLELGRDVDPALIKLTPEQPYALRWRNETQLLVELESGRKDATAYHLELQPQLISVTGAPLLAAQKFALGGKEPRLLVAKQSLEDERIGLYLQFNMNIDLNQIQEYITVRDQLGEPLPYRCQILDQRSLRLDMQSNFLAPRTFVVEVKKGLASPEGPLRLTEAEQFTIRIGEPLVCTDVDGEHDRIRLRFNHRVHQVDKRFLRIELVDAPAFAGLSDYTVKRNYRGVDVKQAFSPGATYRLHVMKGFPGYGRQRLAATRIMEVKIDDRDAALNFADQGLVLSRHAMAELRVKGVNCEQARLEIREVYQQNYVFLCQNYHRLPHAMYGPVLKKSFPLAAHANKDFETRLDMASLFKAKPNGLYEIRLFYGDRYWQNHKRLLHLTDLGLYARFSGQQAIVSCQSIASGAAVTDARLRIYSKQNQLLGEGRSDDQGLALITLRPGAEGDQAFVVCAEKEIAAVDGLEAMTEIAFIDATRFQMGVVPGAQSGRSYIAALPGHQAQEAYVSLDRGIMRPGGTVHALIQVRDQRQEACAGQKVHVQIKNAVGDINQETVLTLNEVGVQQWNPILARDQRSGTWHLHILNEQKELIGKQVFIVEDFEPERLHAQVRSAPWLRADHNECSVTAHWLEGGAAENLKASLFARLDKVTEAPEAWREYNFTDAETKVPGALKEISAQTNKEGTAVFQVPMPDFDAGLQQMRVQLLAEVTGPSGRVTRALETALLDPRSKRLGVTCTKDLARVCVLNRDWTPSRDVETVTLQIEETQWNYYYESKHWRWKKEQTLVHEQEFIVSDGLLSFNCQPYFTEPYALYRITVKTQGNEPIRARCFNTGARAAQNPHRLSVTAPAFTQLGALQEINVSASQVGPAIISLEGVECYQTFRQDLVLGENKIYVQIPADIHEPNLHVVVCQQLPQFAYQSQQHWLLAAAHSLRIKQMPEIGPVQHNLAPLLKPRSRQQIKIHIPGARYACLSLVDYGILQITNHPYADPQKYFEAARRMDFRGLASCMRLMQGARYASMPGGDGDDRLRAAPKVNPYLDTSNEADTAIVALQSELIELDADGYAVYDCVIPDYEGKLRLEIFGFSRDAVLVDHADVTVADDYGLRIAAPRALRPEDQVQIPVSIANRTQQEQRMELRVQFNDDEQSMRTSLHVLAAGARKTVPIDFTAAASGKQILRTSVWVDDERVREQEKQLDVAVASAYRQTRRVYAIEELQDIDVSQWQRIDEIELSFHRDGAVVSERCLEDLIEYPYGCLEQTTSRCMALLAYSRYMKSKQHADVPVDASANWRSDQVSDYVNAGIYRLQRLQLRSGGLSWWPHAGAAVYRYGSLYAYDFLVDAASDNYYVPETLMDNLRSYARSVVADSKSVSMRCYALSVLVKDQQAMRHWLPQLSRLNLSRDALIHLVQVAHYYKDTKALDALMGRLNAAPAAATDASNKAERSGLYSGLRSVAYEIALRCHVDERDPLIDRLQLYLCDHMSRRWDSLHTNHKAALVRALAASAARPSVMESRTVEEEHQYTLASGAWSQEGTSTDGETILIKPDEDNVQIINNLKIALNNPSFARLHLRGLFMGADNDVEQPRLRLQRTMIDVRTHKPVTALKQGQTYRVDLAVHALEPMEHLAVTDVLPAGCELVAQRFDALRSNKKNVQRVHREQRGNKMFLFPEGSPRTFSVSYYIRAVFKGSFQCPAVTAESMYNPQQHLSLEYAQTLQID